MQDEEGRTLEEQLSAAVDGELEDEAWPLLLRRLSDDPVLRARWERYHLIGETMRRPGTAPLATGVAERVAEQLDAEERGVTAAPTRLLRPLAGLAVAASVAAVAIAIVTRSATDATPAADVSPVAQEAALDDEALRQHLTPYLVNHNAYSRTSSRQGLLPYVHVTSDGVVEPPAEPGSSGSGPEREGGTRP